MPDDLPPRPPVRWTWRTWLGVVLAVIWTVVAVVDPDHRVPAAGFAALGVLLAVVGAGRDRHGGP